MTEKVMDIQLDRLVGFRNHPFQVKDDESLNALCESIRDYGVLSPLLARPTADGNYEIVSGHRRKAAAMKLGVGKATSVSFENIFRKVIRLHRWRKVSCECWRNSIKRNNGTKTFVSTFVLRQDFSYNRGERS